MHPDSTKPASAAAAVPAATGAAPAGSPRRLAWLVLLALALVAVGEVVYALSLPLVEQVRPIPDDSFFYLRLAEEFWRCGEFSFDGHNKTYGFQPLWQLLLIALQPLFPDPAQFFHACLALCCILHAAVGFALFRLGTALAGSVAGVVAAALWTLNPAIAVWCGCLKENGLYALLLVVALHNLLRQLRDGANVRQGARLGLWLGLAIVARVNAVLLGGILLGTLLLAVGRGHGLRARLRALLAASVVAAAVGAPWYVYAKLHFGTALPTSGTWKLLMMHGYIEQALQLPWFGFGHLQHAAKELPGYLRFLVGHGYGHVEGVLVALAGLGILARCTSRRATARAGSRWVLFAIVGTALTAAATNMLCLETILRYADWYAVVEFVALPLLAGVGAGAIATHWQQPTWRLLAIVAVVVTGWLWPARAGIEARLQRGLLAAPPGQMALLEMALWQARHVPQGTGIGLWDPGIVSYFSRSRCVSFDPLMNSLDYIQRQIYDPWGYVQSQQIAYMVGAGVPAGDHFYFPPLPKRPGGSEEEYEILWLPYPEHDLGWGEPRFFILVRPRASQVPEFLTPDDFPYGVLYPNDPQRRRLLTGDRDRLLAGLDWQADTLRLKLDLPPDGAPVELLVDGAVRERFTAAQNGWQCRDARAFRGQRVQLRLPPGMATSAVPQAHCIDYTVPVR
jgi:hypothetical protein